MSITHPLATAILEQQMITPYSQKLGPPFSGQVQIVESPTYRAMTLDGQDWEIQYVNRAHIRVAKVSAAELTSQSYKTELLTADADPHLSELLDYLVDIELPFGARDHFEYWVLDQHEQQPLAMMFSCSSAEQMQKFPSYPDWTALPDSVMPINKTQHEIDAKMAPVNYRLERLVAERAGINKKAAWFDRREHDSTLFPPFLVRADWPDSDQSGLYSRYLQRQAPRLLMLQGLTRAQRIELEGYCKPHAVEVARFHRLYPEIIDQEQLKALLVQARIRSASAAGRKASIHDRRDGVLYI